MNLALKDIPIKPIRNDDDLDEALAMIDELWEAEPRTERGDVLEILAALVEGYENKHYSMNTPDAITAIEFRMDQEGLTRKDLEPFIGTRARVSEILNGKRSLTMTMIRKLHEYLGIPLEALVKERGDS